MWSARQRARQIADLCGFAQQDQVRIATSISEVARNAFRYAGRGQVEFAIEGSTAPQTLLMTVRDQGLGIADLALVLSGQYQSGTGMGMGLLGARKLMDAFDVQTAKGQGTTVTMRKLLPPSARLITPRKPVRSDGAGRRPHLPGWRCSKPNSRTRNC
jgi:anti-sigma regulatory factor (Ser/Thr protein kinase)